MRNVRDTFLHYVADNQSFPVRNLRKDPSNPKLSQLQEGSINIQFISDAPQVSVATLDVSIDVVHANELTAVDMMRSVWNLLATTAMTPLMDYTVPASPVQVQGNVFWTPDTIRFRPVATDTYFRYNCLLTISYHIQ